MIWKRLLAYITGSVDQELLLRNEYLATENRILRGQIKGHLRLNDADRINLVEICKRLGRKALEEVAQIVRPDTILAWHCRLVAKKFDGSRSRSASGRPTTDGAIVELILKMARENRSWGYRRIVGVLAFMRVGSRQVCIAGMTPSPNQAWMKQMARNMTLADSGFFCGCKYLLHDRDTKFCAAFDAILDAVGIQTLKLPPSSPNLNAHCERWIRSVKTELLSKLILFGERSLRHCLENYVAHLFHAERNHQGKDNVILLPAPQDRIGESSGSIKTRERLDGLLKFYYREAAGVV